MTSSPVARFQPTQLKPRSASRGDERRTRPARPSMLTRRAPSLIAIAIPTVLMVAAVYIVLAFASRLTNRLLKGDEPDMPEVRTIDTSERPPPFVERTPPPSPEVVAERVRREIEASGGGRLDAPFPILELETEPEPARPVTVPLEPLDLPTRPAPRPTGLLPNGTTPSISTEAP